MAFKGELYVEGPEGELEGPRENGSSNVYAFNHEVYLPFDTEQNLPQGSRRITAFNLTKDIDKLTPTLYQYCCNGTKLPKVTIVLYKIKEAMEVPYFNYTLENVRIVSVKNNMPSTKYEANADVGHLEEIQFLADTFTWNNEVGETGKEAGKQTYTEANPFADAA
jgi:type VI secretion system secreted protein Hcp